MGQVRASERDVWVQGVLCEFLSSKRPSHEDLPREIREVLGQIHQNLFDLHLNVRYLKSRCRIRDNNVSSRFRYLIGVTIKQYVESLRMEAAGLLLSEADLGIFDVAASVGYYNLQTFYRVFERHFHCTPASYRRRFQAYRDRPPAARLDAEAGALQT
jgi:two-component system, response regulator YesN